MRANLPNTFEWSLKNMSQHNVSHTLPCKPTEIRHK